MFKPMLLLILSLTTLKTILGSTELTDCFGCLEPENIKCNNSATPNGIDKFIKEENCLYQLYMDKLQELDCIVMKNLHVPEAELDTKWREVAMEIRDQFYDSATIVDDKICNNCEKNDTFDKYVACMKDYWGSMKEKAETEITKRAESATPDLYTDCTLLGKKHVLVCSNVE